MNPDKPKQHGDASAEEKKKSFSVDRKGESSAGATASKDKERAVDVKRDDGSNTR
jgi:general stress protein YciG